MARPSLSSARTHLAGIERSMMCGFACPKCGTAKTKLAPRTSLPDRLLGALTIYPFRCQLCGHRFMTFHGRLKSNPRRNYERVPVHYEAELRPVHDPSQQVLVQGQLLNLSLRGCRVKTGQRLPAGSRVMLEFHAGEYDQPIMIDEAIVRTRFTDGVGLRFSRLLRSEERRIRQILDLLLPNPSS